MDGPIGEWRRQGFVHAPVLLDERKARERLRRHDALEVVSAARAVDHAELRPVGERPLEQITKWLRAHSSIVASDNRSPGRTPEAAPTASSITCFRARRPPPARARARARPT